MAASPIATARRRRRAELAFHADLDCGGLRIGNVLAARYRAVPWRFGAADYRAALDPAGVAKPLAADGVRAAWDPDLGAAMRRAGRAVAENQLLDVLLPDLAAPGRARQSCAM